MNGGSGARAGSSSDAKLCCAASVAVGNYDSRSISCHAAVGLPDTRRRRDAGGWHHRILAVCDLSQLGDARFGALHRRSVGRLWDPPDYDVSAMDGTRVSTARVIADCGSSRRRKNSSDGQGHATLIGFAAGKAAGALNFLLPGMNKIIVVAGG